jgi:hypothetical protein
LRYRRRKYRRYKRNEQIQVGTSQMEPQQRLLVHARARARAGRVGSRGRGWMVNTVPPKPVAIPPVCVLANPVPLGSGAQTAIRLAAASSSMRRGGWYVIVRSKRGNKAEGNSRVDKAWRNASSVASGVPSGVPLLRTYSQRCINQACRSRESRHRRGRVSDTTQGSAYPEWPQQTRGLPDQLGERHRIRTDQEA